MLALVVFVLGRRAGVARRRPRRPAHGRGRAVERRGRDAVDARRQPAARRAGAAGAARRACGRRSRVRSVTLLRRESEAPASRRGGSGGGLRGTWSCVASVGDEPCLRPGGRRHRGRRSATTWRSCCAGARCAAEDQRVLAAFATQVAVAYEQRRLAEAAEAAVPLAEADRMRTALLNAVSHDLRTPIAVGQGRRHQPAQPRRRLERRGPAGAARRPPTTALDRLTALVTNLLDLSRLQAGRADGARAAGRRRRRRRPRARPRRRPTRDRVDVDVPDDLPEVLADAGPARAGASPTWWRTRCATPRPACRCGSPRARTATASRCG